MFDDLTTKEKEFVAWELMNNAFGTFSPFKLAENVEFPKKDELGGIVLKFIGGGAAYLKTLEKFPTDEELEDIREVARFLEKSFGEYVVINILCRPDIEIYDIDVSKDKDIYIDYVSLRTSHGDVALEILIEKLINNEEFTEYDHFLRVLMPFLGHKDEKEFEIRYSEFLDLYDKTDMELPEKYKLNIFNVWNIIRRRNF